MDRVHALTGRDCAVHAAVGLHGLYIAVYEVIFRILWSKIAISVWSANSWRSAGMVQLAPVLQDGEKQGIVDYLSPRRQQVEELMCGRRYSSNI